VSKPKTQIAGVEGISGTRFSAGNISPFDQIAWQACRLFKCSQPKSESSQMPWCGRRMP